MVGIYKITSPSGKIYIGQSVEIKRRFNSYKRMYVKNKGVVKLYRSFLKYGVDNHIFEVVCECEETQLNDKERYYQEMFDCTGANGLNCRLTKTDDRSGRVSKETFAKMSEVAKGNQNWLGKKHTQETKDKISLANTGRRYSDEINIKKGRKGRESNRKGIMSENHPQSIKVIQYNLDGNFIKEWNSLMDIKRELNFHIGNVSLCINNKLATYKGFKWYRKDILMQIKTTP